MNKETYHRRIPSEESFKCIPPKTQTLSSSDDIYLNKISRKYWSVIQSRKHLDSQHPSNFGRFPSPNMTATNITVFLIGYI